MRNPVATAEDSPGATARARLLDDLPVIERHVDLAGVSTAVLEGGEGPPMILLHGPAEFAAGWARVIPALVQSHRVICPDLPGHGASAAPTDQQLTARGVLDWLGALIEHTCSAPPVLVGRVLGGAIAARFAIDRGDELAALVLVDTFGLEPFAPAPRFELAMHRFFGNPTGETYDRFMDLCSFDLDGVRDGMADSWGAFEAYAVDRVSSPSVMAAAMTMIGDVGSVISPAELDKITVPTTLIWGRHDLATRLVVAEQASARFGWPLHVIDDAGDDPPLEQPAVFVHTLQSLLLTTTTTPLAT